VPCPLGNRAKQGERIWVDGKLLKERVFESTKHVETVLIDVLGQRHNVPD
jgi:hypothetical protein